MGGGRLHLLLGPMRSSQAQRAAIGTFSSLALPDFRLLLVVTVATQLAGWMEEVARGWLIYELTRSPWQLSALSFVSGASLFLFAPLAGFMADRLDRRWATVFSEATSGAVALVLGLLSSAGRVELWALYVLTGLMGASRGITFTTRQALLYDVVGPEFLANAVGLNSVAANVARIMAPSLGGVVIGALGTAAAFFGQALLLLLAIPVTLLLRLRVSAQPVRLPFWESIVEGLRYVRGDMTLLRLYLFIYVPHILIYPYVNLIPVFAEEVLGMGAQGYGFLLTGVGFGSIPGGLMVASMARARNKGLVMGLAAVLYMGMVATFAQSHWLPLSFGALVVGGIGWSMMVSLNQALVQLRLPDAYRGRGLALYNVAAGLTPLGNLAMGGMADALGVQRAVTTFALAGLALSVLVGPASAQVRRL